MAKVYRTARGEGVDMDMLRLANEKTIAIGNMKTNARGDELGHGGKIVKTRAQIMQEYHKLNTPVAIDDDPDFNPEPASVVDEQAPIKNLRTPVPTDDVAIEAESTEYVKPRGSLADAVAKETEVNQELLEPAALRNTPAGVTRI